MSGRGAVLGAFRPIEVELLLERLVRQERRHRHAPAMLGGELVRPVRGAAEEDPEAPRREGNDVRVGNLEVLALVREALVPERGEEEVDRLLVARPRVLVERNPGLLGDPPVAAADSPFIPPAGEDVGHGNDRGEHHRVVVRQRVEHRAEVDVLRTLRRRREERRGCAEIENLGKKKCSIDA